MPVVQTSEYTNSSVDGNQITRRDQLTLSTGIIAHNVRIEIPISFVGIDTDFSLGDARFLSFYYVRRDVFRRKTYYIKFDIDTEQTKRSFINDAD